MGFQFGSVNSLDTRLGTVCLIVIVVFLVLFEYIIKVVEYLKDENNSTYLMIQKIFKEWMIMGVVSFTISMFGASVTVGQGEEVIETIDFVHMLLFFVALFFVVNAFILIHVAGSIAIEYKKFHDSELSNILMDVAKPRTFIQNIFYHSLFLPGSHLRSAVEFKVFHVFFKKTYSLPDSFPFSDYLSGCFEKYALELLDVGVFTWCQVIMLALLNLGRVDISKEFGIPCARIVKEVVETSLSNSSPEGNENNEHNPVPSVPIDIECANYNLGVFALSGLCMCLGVGCLLLMARIYEFRLMKYVGAHSIGDCERILQEGYESRNVKIASATTFITKATLKNNIRELRKEEIKAKREVATIFFNTMNMALDWMQETIASLCSVSYYMKKNDKNSKSYDSINNSTSSEQKRNKRGTRHNILLHVAEEKKKNPTHSHSYHSHTPTTYQNSNTVVANTDASGKKIVTTWGPIEIHVANKMQQSPSSHQGTSNTEYDGLSTKYGRDSSISIDNNGNGNGNELKLHHDVNDIFAFGSSKLFFRAVEFFVMLNCLYMALWATSFITVARYAPEDGIVWQIILLLPIIVTIPCLSAIVSRSSKLLAVTELDVDVIGKIIEEEEETALIVKELRIKIFERVDQLGLDGDRKTVLDDLFREIDTNGNGEISKIEFRKMLWALNLHYSTNKSNRLFHTIDVDKGGFLTIEEFTTLLVESEEVPGACSYDFYSSCQD